MTITVVRTVLSFQLCDGRLDFHFFILSFTQKIYNICFFLFPQPGFGGVRLPTVDRLQHRRYDLALTTKRRVQHEHFAIVVEPEAPTFNHTLTLLEHVCDISFREPCSQ